IVEDPDKGRLDLGDEGDPRIVGIEGGDFVAVVDDEEIASRASVERIDAAVVAAIRVQSVENVVVFAAEEPVVAPASRQDIVAATTVQRVVAVLAAQRVGSAAGAERIAVGAADQERVKVEEIRYAAR